MTTREKALEIINKTISHLKAIRELQQESIELGADYLNELERLYEEDDQFIQLSEEISKIINDIGF